MRRTLRALGWVVWYSFFYVTGLAFVAYLTDGVYADLHANAAWDECDDCGPFMMTEAQPWVVGAVLLYTGAWAVFTFRQRRRSTHRASEPGRPAPVV